MLFFLLEESGYHSPERKQEVPVPVEDLAGGGLAPHRELSRPLTLLDRRRIVVLGHVMLTTEGGTWRRLVGMWKMVWYGSSLSVSSRVNLDSKPTS